VSGARTQLRSRLLLALAAAAALALAVARLPAAAAAAGEAEASAAEPVPIERQILVMLRMPAPHFRPDESYGGAYDAHLGRQSRHRMAADIARTYGLELLSDWPMPALGVECYVMAVPQSASAQEVSAVLARDGRTESVQPMNRFHALGHNDPLYPLQPSATSWHLADLHTLTTGRRVLVAQIDSGVETDHPDLAGQIAATENFVDGEPYTGEEHGTAVAGIIGARADNGIGIVGIAPGARILALRACWQRGTDTAACSSFSLAKALQFALDRGPQVINLSLAGPADPLLARLIDVAIARGIAVVAAADPLLADGGFPASHPDVIAVAADETSGAAPTLLAPGHDVPTTLPPSRWGLVSGASFAAAHVTGLIALLDELAPSISPRRLRQLLGEPARPITAAASSDSGNAIRSRPIDACAIVARVAATCACACPIAETSTHGIN
jgi:Subtilase family